MDADNFFLFEVRDDHLRIHFACLSCAGSFVVRIKILAMGFDTPWLVDVDCRRM
jgi:hypothetical protein